MKMSSQSRSFAKQVQVDLLALNDADLFTTVHQWVNGSNATEPAIDLSEEIYIALGYTRTLVQTGTLSHHSYDSPAAAHEDSGWWQAPTPHQMRSLITAMDINAFTSCIISPAFQVLHPTYPEWFEGTTFNAHLANYLRQLKRRTRE